MGYNILSKNGYKVKFFFALRANIKLRYDILGKKGYKVKMGYNKLKNEKQ